MRSEQAERLFGEFAAVAAATADRPFDLETERANAEAAGTLPTEAAGVAVEEVTIAGHMLEMLMALDRVGKDLDTRSSLHAPSLRFAELAISGA
jgi:hypothetical protein